MDGKSDPPPPKKNVPSTSRWPRDAPISHSRLRLGYRPSFTMQESGLSPSRFVSGKPPCSITGSKLVCPIPKPLPRSVIDNMKAEEAKAATKPPVTWRGIAMGDGSTLLQNSPNSPNLAIRASNFSAPATTLGALPGPRAFVTVRESNSGDSQPQSRPTTIARARSWTGVKPKSQYLLPDPNQASGHCAFATVPRSITGRIEPCRMRPASSRLPETQSANVTADVNPRLQDMPEQNASELTNSHESGTVQDSVTTSLDAAIAKFRAFYDVVPILPSHQMLYGVPGPCPGPCRNEACHVNATLSPSEVQRVTTGCDVKLEDGNTDPKASGLDSVIDTAELNAAIAKFRAYYNVVPILPRNLLLSGVPRPCLATCEASKKALPSKIQGATGGVNMKPEDRPSNQASGDHSAASASTSKASQTKFERLAAAFARAKAAFAAVHRPISASSITGPGGIDTPLSMTVDNEHEDASPTWFTERTETSLPIISYEPPLSDEDEEN